MRSSDADARREEGERSVRVSAEHDRDGVCVAVGYGGYATRHRGRRAGHGGIVAGDGGGDARVMGGLSRATGEAMRGSWGDCRGRRWRCPRVTGGLSRRRRRCPRVARATPAGRATPALALRSAAERLCCTATPTHDTTTRRGPTPCLERLMMGTVPGQGTTTETRHARPATTDALARHPDEWPRSCFCVWMAFQIPAWAASRTTTSSRS